MAQNIPADGDAVVVGLNNETPVVVVNEFIDNIKDQIDQYMVTSGEDMKITLSNALCLYLAKEKIDMDKRNADLTNQSLLKMDRKIYSFYLFHFTFMLSVIMNAVLSVYIFSSR